MPKLQPNLVLYRCPHCNIDKPNLHIQGNRFESSDHAGGNRRVWATYICGNCGGVVVAAAREWNQHTIEIYPLPSSVDEAIPDRARQYLEQALNSIHAPAGAVMLAASAVDAMLKEKEYKEGSLYNRIEKAAEDHLITKEMAKWAHDVRLDANDQRHADEQAALPTSEDAKRVIDFVTSLAQFLFVLPEKVQRGIEDASQ